MAVSPTWVGPWVASRSWVKGKKGGGGREIGTGHRSWVAVGGCGFWMMGHRS